MKLRETGVTWLSVGEDIVVLDLDGSVYLQINGSGRVLWEALSGSADESQLVECLMDRFGIERPQAENDVTAFVAQLRSRDLVAE